MSVQVYYDCALVIHTDTNLPLLDGYQAGSYSGTGNVCLKTSLSIDSAPVKTVDSYSVVKNLVEYEIRGIKHYQKFESLKVESKEYASSPGKYLASSVTWSPQLILTDNSLTLNAVIKSELANELEAHVTLIDGHLLKSAERPVYSRSMMVAAAVPDISSSDLGQVSYSKYNLNIILVPGENHVQLARETVWVADLAVINIDYQGKSKGMLGLSFVAPWYLPPGPVYLYEDDSLVGVVTTESHAERETVVLTYRPTPSIFANIGYTPNKNGADTSQGVYTVDLQNPTQLMVYLQTSRLKPVNGASPAVRTGGYYYYPAGTDNKFTEL